MKEWLKALALAALKGAVPAVSVLATAFATDGFTGGEVKILGAVFVAGALAGVAVLFQTPPRDQTKRQRIDD